MGDIQFPQQSRNYLKEHHINPHGLASHEAHTKIKALGLNTLAENTKRNAITALLSKFNNPLILILLFASSISAATGELINFFIIISIVLLSVVMDFFQEYQSEQAADKLRKKVTTHALVLRDHHQKDIPLSHVTLSDIVYLEIGDIIPADGIILYQRDLHIDESTLTGEAFPAEKNDLAEVYMGSSVVNGEAVMVVTAIGKNTQFGKIAHALSSQKPPTDFEKGIRSFGLLVAQITFVLVTFIFIFNIFVHHDIITSLIFALALAVGLTPELLPLIVTINLVQGALRMAKKGVIVKHLPSIQNIGSMNILCTDKTGTLTENAIELERYENIYGDEDKNVLQYAYLNSFFQSNLRNPLDEAVLKHKEAHLIGYTKVDEIPFDFIRKRLSVVVKNSKTFLISKGAPVALLELCTHCDNKGEIAVMTEPLKAKLLSRFRELSLQGFRVLAVTYKVLNDGKKTYTKEDETDLVFMGFTAFFDPPKLSAREVLERLTSEGIKLKILTGDNELVTKKVCEELHIPIERVVLGPDLNDYSEEECRNAILHANVFARLTPDQKKHIIEVLKQEGFIVGYLGDGVNDAPSLKTADIGISVNNAIDVAKEAADMILVTKSLRVLYEGVQEGRRTFANVLKYIFVGMGSNFGNMISVSISSLFLPFLPLLPIQILLNNLLYDFSQLAIPFDNVDETFMEKPLKWDINYIKRFIMIFGPLSSLFDFITFFVLFVVLHSSVSFFRTGWFLESIITQSLIILSLRTTRVPFFKSTPHPYLLMTSIGIPVIAYALIQSPYQNLFQFVSLNGIFLLYMLAILVVYFICVEVAKMFFYRKSL